MPTWERPVFPGAGSIRPYSFCLTARPASHALLLRMVRRDRDLVPTRKEGLSTGDWIRGAVIGLVLAAVLRWIIHGFLVFPVVLSSADMAPALPAGSKAYFLRIFSATSLERGAIVLIRHPNDDEQWMVRRVVGLPGEQVQIHARKLFINNEPVAADWERQIQKSIEYPGDAVSGIRRDFAGPLIVKDGEIFLLADNRRDALDSRQLGTLSMDAIEAVLW